MGAETGIPWTDATFNPWIGCTKVSAGCKHCYAEVRDHRWGNDRWGPGKLRTVTSASNWRTPIAWNAAAAKAGIRTRVFCASLADVFDDEAPEGAREWLWNVIEATPALDWQLLTKRPQNIAKMIPAAWLERPRENVWFGTTVEDQAAANERIPHLLRVPAVVRFLSCEPLIAAVDLTRALVCAHGLRMPCKQCESNRRHNERGGYRDLAAACGAQLHWVIVGGESGHGARSMRLEWAWSLVGQCQAAGVPVFVKQLGARPTFLNGAAVPVNKTAPIQPFEVSDGHGGNIDEFPADLRVREFPGAHRG